MNDQHNDFAYVKQALEAAGRHKGYPAIYVLWGVIVLSGFTIAELSPSWVSVFWYIAAPTGFLISALIGRHGEKQRGQLDSANGEKYVYHYAIMLAFIFLAMFTQEYNSIFLILGLAYSLAGLHLERMMLPVGVLSALLYVGIEYGWVNSPLLIGIVFALGLFLSAWGVAKMNSDATAQA